MTELVVDYSAALLSGAALKSAGVTGAVRYIGAGTNRKFTTAAEYADLVAHGIKVGLVAEKGADFMLTGRAAGAQTARDTLAASRAAGIPDGVLYAAVDFDATLGGATHPDSAGDKQMAKVLDTLTGFADVLGWANVGVYGGYYVIDWLVAKGARVAAYWQTAAWSHGLIHAKAALYQHIGSLRVAGVDCDRNTVIGDWKPRTAVAKPTPAPVQAPEVKHVAKVDGKNMNRLHPTFRAQLQALADRTGHDIWCQSTGRTDAEQAYLYNGWKKGLKGFNPANPPGGPSWHRYVEGKQHAQAADITPGRALLGPHVAAVGLSFAISREAWHLQPIAKHPEVSFTTAPVEEDEVAVLKSVTAASNNRPREKHLLATALEQVDPTRKINQPGGGIDHAALDHALRDFQTFFHVPGGSDGVCGTNTWRVLFGVLAKSDG